MEFLPFTASSLINKHVQRIIADEYDAYDPALGDPIQLLNPRRRAAGADSKLLAISHPDLGGPITLPPERQRGIMRLREQRPPHLVVALPALRRLLEPQPGHGAPHALDYPEDAPLDVVGRGRRLCPVNGCVIEDGRHAMNVAGRWVCAGRSIDEDGHVTQHPSSSRTAGFWIPWRDVPFVMGHWRPGPDQGGGRAGDRRWQREGKDLRTAMVKGGEPLDISRAPGSVDAQALADRVSPPCSSAWCRRGSVPDRLGGQPEQPGGSCWCAAGAGAGPGSSSTGDPPGDPCRQRDRLGCDSTETHDERLAGDDIPFRRRLRPPHAGEGNHHRRL